MLISNFINRILVILVMVLATSFSFANVIDEGNTIVMNSENVESNQDQKNDLNNKKIIKPIKGIEFNSNLLDLSDNENFQLGYFSNPDYIPPGNYFFNISLNKNGLTEGNVQFYVPGTDETETEACLTPKLVKNLGLLKKMESQLQWEEILSINETCLDVSSLGGMLVDANIANGTLMLSIPQSYLEYQNSYWIPPSLWSTGINGFIADYNVSANWIYQNHTADNNIGNVNALGLVGYNLGAWRLRSEWQANYKHIPQGNEKAHDFHWNRFFAYRPIPELKAQLTLGENYLITDVFDSFRYTGASLVSDINMIPPNLRAYAPEITGTAQTNALVTVSQLGRVIYQSVVPPGPFNIRSLNEGVSGTLNVRVEEQDGAVQEFSVETTNVPFLTRPGQIRYKTAIGRPSNFDHKIDGDLFATGEFSWGINSDWSLIGGGVFGAKYNALALGLGRDLKSIGAISLDVTHSRADLPSGENLSGQSYRINYSKSFQEMGGQLQLAGYRFSEENFMSMSEFLNASDYSGQTFVGRNKELYRVAWNQVFPSQDISLNLNLSKQTFWNGTKDREYYNITASKIFNFDAMKGVTTSFNFYQNRFEEKEWGAFLSVAIPLDNGARVGYSVDRAQGTTRNRASYSDILDERTNYQVNYGYSDLEHSSLGAYLNHRGDRARFNVSANHQQDRYSSIAFNVQGGVTATAKGADFHRISTMDGTRILMDTDGVENIPLRVYGPTTPSNRFGKVVIGDVSSYYRNQIRVDLNKIPTNADVSDSVLYSTLTKGAIGYKKVDILSGEKQLVTLKLDTGSYVPFGSQVLNETGRLAGMVDDKGLTYLAGIKDGHNMKIQLSADQECVINFSLENKLSLHQVLICKVQTITGSKNDKYDF